MKKYYLGLLIIGLLTIGLAAYVINVGMQGKQDKQTYDKAQEIAEKLNDHISKEQEIPATLSEIDVSDAPGSISYEKLSSKQYKFCVTYKTSRGYGTGDITSTLTGAALSGMYGGSLDYESNYESSRLYIPYTYEKGENCQTIKPTIYDFSDSDEDIFSEDSLYEMYCSDPESRVTFGSYCDSLDAGGDTPSANEL